MSRKIKPLAKKGGSWLWQGAAFASALPALWLAVTWLPTTDNAFREPAATFSTENDAPQSFHFRPVAGKRYVYSYERKIRFSGFMKGGLPEVAYHGNFFVDVLSTDAYGFEAILSEQVLEAGGKISPLLLARISATGEQLQLYNGNSIGEEEKQHENITKDLAAHWLFPLRSDTVGDYSARFESLPGEGNLLRRKKIKISYSIQSKIAPDVLSSLHILLWDPTLSLPAEVQGRENTQLGKSGATLAADSRYRLRFLGTEAIPHYTKTQLAALVLPGSLALATSGNMGEHPDYANLNWSLLLSQLLDLDRMTAKQRLDVFGDLMRFLRAHPEKVAEVAKLLQAPGLLQKGAESSLFKTLVGALATLGGGEAQTALREAYGDHSIATSGKGAILSGLTTTQASLDAATRDFLVQAMRSEKNTALAHGAAFALGSSLQTAGNDPQAGRSIAAIERNWLTQSKAGIITESLALLDVMGNSGRTEFLSTLQGVIGNNASSPQLRSRAVFSLRFVNSPTATEELVRSLRDTDPGVREAAAKAITLATWSEAFRRPLEACTTSDSVGRIQSACRKALEQGGSQMAYSPTGK